MGFLGKLIGKVGGALPGISTAFSVASVGGSLIGKLTGGGGGGADGVVDLSSRAGIQKFKSYSRAYKYKHAKQRGFKTPKQMVLNAESLLGKASSVSALDRIFGKQPQKTDIFGSIKQAVQPKRSKFVKGKGGPKKPQFIIGRRKRAIPAFNKVLTPLQRQVFGGPGFVTPTKKIPARKFVKAKLSDLNISQTGKQPSQGMASTIFGIGKKKKARERKEKQVDQLKTAGLVIGGLGLGLGLLRLFK